MNWADIVIIIIIAVSSFVGLWRGFVKEALSLLVWAAALLVAVTFRQEMAQMLASSIETPSLREVAAFGLLFILTLVVGALVNHLISAIVKLTGLSGTDRILGMVFGILRGVVIIMAILLVLPGFIPINEDGWWKESLIIPHFLSFEDWARELFDQFVAVVSDLFKQTEAVSSVESESVL